jgi:hypothetical protein
MATTNLFDPAVSIFQWKDIKTFLIRNQYNEILNKVADEYFNRQYTGSIVPNFLNEHYCLTLKNFDEKCLSVGTSGSTTSFLRSNTNAANNVLMQDNVELENRKTELKIATMQLDLEYSRFQQTNWSIDEKEQQELDKLASAIKDKKNVAAAFQAAKDALKTNTKLKTSLAGLDKVILDYDTANNALISEVITQERKQWDLGFKEKSMMVEYERLKALYEIAQRNFDLSPTADNQQKQAAAKASLEAAPAPMQSAAVNSKCLDDDRVQFLLPKFYYSRLQSIIPPFKDRNGNPLDINFSFATNSLTVGAVIWLYYYERMGIFKILGVLMDDYNYRGKYTISGNRKDKNGNINNYSALMDMVCSLHRIGIGSNIRDRICTYQRVLGVSIENNLGIESEHNTGFMQTFNKLLDYMLEYYKTKQLAVAINNAGQTRSSVATQTSIRDTMNVLKQQFEPFQYGRNQENTFLGIAMVHATLCLLNNLRKEIGIPDQYERPEEFIPAAYDILVAKKAVTLNESNRFIIHDNCASYGYRLLTDIETADLTQFSTVSTGGSLDLWLDDIEGLVEGYRNAYSSLEEKATAIV